MLGNESVLVNARLGSLWLLAIPRIVRSLISVLSFRVWHLRTAEQLSDDAASVERLRQLWSVLQ